MEKLTLSSTKYSQLKKLQGAIRQKLITIIYPGHPLTHVEGEKTFPLDWILLGAMFNLTLVLLFLFSGIIDVNLAYLLKGFFLYIVIGLTIAMLFAGVIEWVLYKIKKVGDFSIGMLICVVLLMIIVLLSSFVPALVPISNALLANDSPYTKDAAQSELVKLKSFYSNQLSTAQARGDLNANSALYAIYFKSTSIGESDIDFFQSKFDFATSGPTSGVKTYALIKTANISIDSMSVAITKFGTVSNTSISTELYKSINDNNSKMALILNIAASTQSIDETKLRNIPTELQKQYPNYFWIEASKSVAITLAEFLEFKKSALPTYIDSNDFISAFITAQQIINLQEAYGKQT